MTRNDKKLLGQMIKAGRFSYAMYELLVEQNKRQAKTTIKRMGNKWVCHPDNYVKRLEVPLPLLSRESKILRKIVK
jgi:hypothetical protein